MEQLQKRLAASEAETKRLRELVGGEAAPKKCKLSKKPAAAAESEGTSPAPEAAPGAAEEADAGADKALSHKERKRLQRAAYKAAKRAELKKAKATERKAQKKAQAEAKPPAVAEGGAAEEAAAVVEVCHWISYMHVDNLFLLWDARDVVALGMHGLTQRQI